ncbi:hypothetical protein CRYUN_Cryun14cG0110800 [Craigia yunnanensis]
MRLSLSQANPNPNNNNTLLSLHWKKKKEKKNKNLIYLRFGFFHQSIRFSSTKDMPHISPSPKQFFLINAVPPWRLHWRIGIGVRILLQNDGSRLISIISKDFTFTKQDGSHIWVGDSELAWIDGIVTNVDGAEAEIQTSDGRMVTTNLSKLYPKNVEAPAGGVDDMTKLSYLHEPAVLYNLATRYEINEIYTYCGNILIAINPFQALSHVYDVYLMERYKGAQIGELSPHVFAIADIAYSRILFLKHLAMQKLSGITITIRGAAIRTYFLEKSPVCQISDPERNYHCFDLLCAAPLDVADQFFKSYQEIKRSKLGDPKSLHYLNQSSCYELVGVDDSHDYLATRKAMDIVGISEKEQGEEDSSILQDDKSKFHLQMTAEILMCDPQALEVALCKRIMITPEEIMKGVLIHLVRLLAGMV